MERILLSHNKRGYEKALRLLKADLIIYNDLIKIISENIPKVLINKENIVSLLDDAKSFLFDLVVDKSQLNFNGLPISKKKAIELIDFPKEYNVVISACQITKQALSKAEHVVDPENSIDRLSFDDITLESGAFSFNEGYLEAVKEDFSSYTRNEKQNEAYRFSNQILEGIIGLHAIGAVSIHSMDEVKNLGIKFYDNQPLLDTDKISSIR